MVIDLDNLSKGSLINRFNDFIAIGDVIPNFVFVKLTNSDESYS